MSLFRFKAGYMKGAMLVLACGLMGSAAANEPSTVQFETLLKTDKSWDGTSYTSYPSGPPQITVLKITIPPNAVLPWHTHPMPNAAYVLEGQLTVEKANGQHETLGPGKVLAEMVNAVHRGHAGDRPVKLIVFYAGTAGQELAIPAREPENRSE